MASYAVLYNDLVATGNEDIVALVVTDGITTRAYPTDDTAGLTDIEWPVGDPDAVLRAGLVGLYYYTIDGPHTFEGTTGEAAEPLAAVYGLL